MHGQITRVAACLIGAASMLAAPHVGAQAKSLDELLQQTRAARSAENKENERRIQEFRSQRNQQAALLKQAKAELAALERRADELSTTFDQNEETLAELGSLAAARDGLSALSYRAVELLDLDPVGNAETVEATTAAARDWIKGLQQRVEAFIERSGITPSPKLAAVTRDIVKTTSIAGGAHAIRAERRARNLMK